MSVWLPRIRGITARRRAVPCEHDGTPSLTTARQYRTLVRDQVAYSYHDYCQ